MIVNKKQAGFTLIEMMVVVVVIALLGGMIGPTLINKLKQAEQTRVAQDIRVIESAIKMYRIDNFSYPTSSQGLEALMSDPGGAGNWGGPYLGKAPEDPWGEPYKYENPGRRGKEVDIYTLGADNQEGGEDSNADWGNWNIK